MKTEVYRAHRLELTERENFWDIDIFYGVKTQNLYAYVFAAKSASIDSEAVRERAHAVVDEKIYDDIGRLHMRAANYEARQW